jgi:hypothetical protein
MCRSVNALKMSKLSEQDKVEHLRETTVLDLEQVNDLIVENR